MTGESKTRVFIYGSCVSRDTFELLNPDRYSLLAYVARQSLISAFGPSTELETAPGDLSPFQRRMVEGDLRGDLRTKLAAAAGAIDLLLWDLTDERLGVYQMAAGGFVTRTPDIIGAGLERSLAQSGRLITFGTPEHLALWQEATAAWKALLLRLGLLARTLVLGPPWAERSSDGSAVPASFGLAAERANALYVPYYDHVKALGFAVAQVDSRSATASAEHRWGLAPFHYDLETYHRLIGAIDQNALPPEDATP